MVMDKKRKRPRNRQTRAQQFFANLALQVVPHAEAMILHLDDPESRRVYQQDKDRLVEQMTFGWIMAASMTDEQRHAYHEAWRERLESTTNQLDFAGMAKEEDLLTNFQGRMRDYLIEQLFMDDLFAFAQCWFINIVCMDGSWKYVADMLEEHGYEWQDFRIPGR